MTNRLFRCLFFFVFCCSGLFGFGKEVVKISTSPAKQGIAVNFSIDQGYGIQRDARNKVDLVYLKGRSKHTVKHFTGNVSSEDDRYYNTLNAINIPYDSISPAELNVLFYYCQFKNKFCSVQKSKINLP